jgi:hypothetical protein
VYTNVLKNVSDGILSKIIQSLFALHLFLAFLILINPVALEFEDLINIPKSKTHKCILYLNIIKKEKKNYCVRHLNNYLI